jgi:hypothetical protein
MSKERANIACSGQVRALPSLEGIQRLWHFLPSGFICQIPHLPLTLAVSPFFQAKGKQTNASFITVHSLKLKRLSRIMVQK